MNTDRSVAEPLKPSVTEEAAGIAEASIDYLRAIADTAEAELQLSSSEVSRVIGVSVFRGAMAVNLWLIVTFAIGWAAYAAGINMPSVIGGLFGLNALAFWLANRSLKQSLANIGFSKTLGLIRTTNS